MKSFSRTLPIFCVSRAWKKFSAVPNFSVTWCLKFANLGVVFFRFISGKMVKLCSWYVRHIMTHIWLTLWLKNVGELFCTPHIQLFQRSNSTAVLDYTRKSEAPSKTKEILLKNSWQKENQNHGIVEKTPRLIDTVDKGKQINSSCLVSTSQCFPCLPLKMDTNIASVDS